MLLVCTKSNIVHGRINRKLHIAVDLLKMYKVAWCFDSVATTLLQVWIGLYGMM